MYRLLSWAIFVSLVISTGCSSSENDAGEGDFDRDDSEIEIADECKHGESSCNESIALICTDGIWIELADCADEEKICEEGQCVFAPSDGDLDQDEEAQEHEEQDHEPPPDTNPPEILSTSPSDGATGVDPAIDEVLINFTETLDPENVLIQRAVSMDSPYDSVFFTGSLQNQNKQIKLTFNPLDEGTLYTVTVADNRLKDLAGNYFTGASFSFTTSGESDGDVERDEAEEDIPDTQAPIIDRTTPENGETNVAPQLSSIRIIFSEAMLFDGWEAGDHVLVSGSSGHRPSWSPERENGDKHLRLDLEEWLEAGTTYTVTIDDSLTDLAGNELPAYSFSFTIEAIDGDTDGEDSGIPNTAIVDDVATGRCKADPATFNPEEWPQALETAVDGDELTVIHRNAAIDNCADRVSIDLIQNGDTLDLFETPVVPTSCEEDCPLDITITLRYLFPGEYNIRVWPESADDPLTVNATVTP